MTKEPWELYPSIWKSKIAFFTYLRGHLRLLWSRYPAKLKWKASQMVKPPKDYKGKAKSLGRCYYCREWFAASNLEVDHVQQAGQCNSWETANQFLHNLLNCNDNWVLADKTCHKIKSHAEKMGISFEEAAIQKQVIAFIKEHSVKEIVAFLQSREYNNCSNATKRKAALLEIFTKEAKEKSK